MKKPLAFIFAAVIMLAAVPQEALAAGHTVSISKTDASCNALCNGTATSTVSGGTGPFSYSWAPGGETTPNVNNLCAGSYTLTVTDQSDNSTATTSVTILQPTVLTITTTVNNVTCNGGNNGSITTIVSGGTSPYTYIWSTNQTTSTATNLVAGTYTITVTDANGCTSSALATVTQPTPVNVNAGPDITVCLGGSVQLQATGATTYTWSPPNALSTTTGCCPVSSPTGTITYTVVGTDASGCTGTDAITIFVDNVIATASSTSSTCAQSGSVTGTAWGGSPPYSYMWSNGCTAPTCSNLPAGTYTLTVVDVMGCMATVVTTVANQQMSISTSSVNATCNQSNGSATASASNGTPPYTYSWNSSPVQNTQTATNLSAGVYTVTVTDGTGCIDSTVVAVSNSNGPSLNATSVTNVTCNGGADGSATVSGSGGTPPYTYSWNVNPPQTGTTAINLAAGIYNVSVTDANNCITFIPVTIGQPGQLFLAASSTYANCTGNGSAYAWASGGTPPYTYNWNSNPPQTTASATGLASGTYSVVVTDSNGCAAGGAVTVYGFCNNLLTGKVYIDQNSNCVKDAGDYSMAGQMLMATPGPYYGSTDTAGNYNIWVPNSGPYSLSIVSPLSYGTSVCPASGTYSVSFAAQGDTAVNDFARYIPPIQDLSISLVTGIARPGFPQNGTIMYRNDGSITMSGSVTLLHDSILTFTGATPPASSYSYPLATWNFTNLMPGEVRYIFYTMTVPTIQNGGFLGRQLFNNAKVYPFTGDSTQWNNSEDEVDIIQGSYDPNMKEVTPAGIGPNGIISPADTVMKYTIHFQNTGTDTAFTITVIDTLSSYLDPATVISGASSHPYTFEAMGSGILKWTFNNILLPDSNTNEPLSHGFVAFTIHQTPGNPIGTVITNEADIYFDFNAPVTTNAVINTIDTPTVIKEVVTDEGALVYPNPFSDEVTIIVRNGIQEMLSLEIYNTLGERVHTDRSMSSSFTVKKNDMSPGIYLYRVVSSKGVVAAGKLIAE